jgi:halocyanin-like protein
MAAVGLLAGCSGGGDDGGSGSEGSDGGSGSDGTDGESGSDGGDGGPREASQAVADYLSESSNFDGQLAGMTGLDTVTVEVGSEANGGAYGFAPSAIVISQGTTVEFDWTGEGSTHNVVSEEDGPLDSGSAVEAEGVQYDYTFEETGTHLYNCVPHASLGMKGAVVVE